MSKNSTLQVSPNIGRRWAVRRVSSIATKGRRIVFFCLVMLLVFSLATIGSMRFQSTQVDFLVLTIGPAVDTNIEIFRDMTVARAEILQYQVSGDPNQLVLFRAKKVLIDNALAQIHNYVLVLAQHSSNDLDQRLTNLETIQRDSVERWMAYALVIEGAVIRGETTVSSTEVGLFEGFRRANSAFDNDLESERGRARIKARTASNRGITVVIAAALMTSVVMLVFGLRLTRTISAPIIDLSETMKRQRAGDLSTRAKENRGSLETRNLARNFNVLIEHETELRRIQTRALQMHELISTIGKEIGIAPITTESLKILCATLGSGLGVDRVMVDNFGNDDESALNAQWHHSKLPSVESRAGHKIAQMNALAFDLWQTNGFLVSSDSLAPEAQSDPIQIVYRNTDARAFIFVPVGSGDRVIGMIFVVMVDEPRQWADSEVSAVGRVAEILARFFMEDTFRVQQFRNVERLEQLNIQKENFVATVSHELRTPLTSIIGYLEVLNDGYAGELTGEQSRLIDVLNRNASRLLALINNLLKLTKSESGTNVEDVVDVSISELIRESCNELPPIAHSAGIKIEIDAGPKLALVRGDKGQLKSVIVNIISNAIKFSRPGGVVTIRCTLDEETNRIRIIVKDRGIGIPAADQKELFTRFFRGRNATAKFIPGTGLGLSIVKQIVNDHGGSVEIASIEGEGTTVTVDLPLASIEVGHSPEMK